MNDRDIINELADKPLPKPYEIDGVVFQVTPCIKSGFCCTKAPCAYGEWNEDKSACKYLEAPNAIGQRTCGRYEWIKANVPGWEMYPAFGGGCCMPLGNIKRQEIIKLAKNK